MHDSEVLGITLFLVFNVAWVLLMRHLTSSLLCAIAIHFAFYFYLIRQAVIWAVFPGSCFIFKRNLELTYMKNMGSLVLQHIQDFKQLIDVFRASSVSIEFDRTKLLAITSSNMRLLISQLTKQV
jgi:hypothetical protein